MIFVFQLELGGWHGQDDDDFPRVRVYNYAALAASHVGASAAGPEGAACVLRCVLGLQETKLLGNGSKSKHGGSSFASTAPQVDWRRLSSLQGSPAVRPSSEAQQWYLGILSRLGRRPRHDSPVRLSRAHIYLEVLCGCGCGCGCVVCRLGSLASLAAPLSITRWRPRVLSTNFSSFPVGGFGLIGSRLSSCHVLW